MTSLNFEACALSGTTIQALQVTLHLVYDALVIASLLLAAYLIGGLMMPGHRPSPRRAPLGSPASRRRQQLPQTFSSSWTAAPGPGEHADEMVAPAAEDLSMGPKEAGSAVDPLVLQDAGIDAAPELWSLSQAPHPTPPLQPLESLRKHPGQVKPCSTISHNSMVDWHTHC